MGARLREFRILLGDDDLLLCERAGVSPDELIPLVVGRALDVIRTEQPADEAVEETEEAAAEEPEDGE